jgi:hypothetical protein
VRYGYYRTYILRRREGWTVSHQQSTQLVGKLGPQTYQPAPHSMQRLNVLLLDRLRGHEAHLRVAFQGLRVTSNAALILLRELDERLGFGELIKQHLADPRGKNTRLPLADLLRQSVYSRLAGYEDVNDAEQLSQDPTFRLIGSEKNWD